jgi:hypothetical protein
MGPLQAEDTLCVVDLRFRNRHSYQLDAMRVAEAGLDGAQRHECADHQAGAHEQDQRERDLHYHERVPRPVPLAPVAGGPPAGAQRRRDPTAAEHVWNRLR